MTLGEAAGDASRSGSTGGGGPGVTWLGDRRLSAVLLALGLLAIAIRLVSVLRGGGLLGDHGFDDGVYLAAAVSFTSGRIPYVDFNLLHPPGIIYTLTPFALLGSVAGDTSALAAMRLAFIVLGGVNTVLAGLVGRRALGPAGAVAAAAIYAAWAVPANVERTAWLVGPQNTLLLLALLALAGATAGTLTWRRAAAAGVCLGVSGALQIWAALPAVVILLWLVVRLRGSLRQVASIAGAYVVAGLVAVGALLGPMLLLAGPRMIDLVFWTQLARGAADRTGLVERIRHLEGVPAAGRLASLVPDTLAVGLFAAGLVVAVVVARRTPAARLWVALLVAKLVFLFYTSVFYRHYAGWIAPEAALIAASAIVLLAAAARRESLRRATVAVLAGAIVALALVAALPAGARVPLSTTVPDLSAARCVTADAPLLLLRTEALRRNLANGCPLLLNPGGLSNILNAERPGPNLVRARLPEYQEAMRSFFTSGDAALFGRLDKLGLTDETWQHILSRLPAQEQIGRIVILRRQ